MQQFDCTGQICYAIQKNGDDADEEHFFKALEKARYISMQDSFLMIECEGFDKPLKFSRLESSE